MTLKQQILKEWDKLNIVRQSYGQIAKKLGCNKTYVFRVVKAQKTAPRGKFKAKQSPGIDPKSTKQVR